MKRRDLKKLLQSEIERWEGKTYGELAAQKYPVVYEHAKVGEPDYYIVEVDLLEKEAEYIHLSVAVDDGGVSAFVPVSGGAIVKS